MTDPVSAGEAVPVAQLDYEAARDELAEVVSRLEHGGLGLDESLALWERGEALAAHCLTQLQGASERIEKALDGTQ
ncbi:exodeoxyribonuclease VII small subunit [Gordonia hirsuta DSM 44140 = NBRC 16056]|uniref:Exodeoxyribonuclease 7 small subunit n=1 Tax=Gordonia hirsuta DSM 44140 = NBRC 16056 TaxID=1121927 RepID=L7LDQ4_9ACTN|nr:exodeoxyribonuclease VII small subunit [Gordonia hirsuta]GAC58886.1 exodeoxyribonuclease VII small subunit [Gordonia hirsuta DSM 44140 = NBRC 16056]